MRSHSSIFAFVALAILALPATVLAQPADVIASRRLVLALNAENSASSLVAIEDLRQSSSRRLEAERLLPALVCVEAELREEALGNLAADAVEAEDDIDASALRNLAQGLSYAVIDARDAYDRCIEQGPSSLPGIRSARPTYRERYATLEALEPRTSALAQSLRQSADSPNRPREGGALKTELLTTLRSLARAATSEGPHGFDVARAYVGALHLPAQPMYWRARTFVPALMTYGLAVGVGAVSLLGSVTILGPEGPPVPMLVSTGFGFLVSGGVAALSAYTWQRPSLPIWLTATVLTAGTGALGIYARVRGDRRRRYLGRGLMIGSGLSVFWLVGGLVHLTHEARLERAWRRYLEGPVQLAPMADQQAAGLMATGRF